jgi:hypothetical protein
MPLSLLRTFRWSYKPPGQQALFLPHQHAILQMDTSIVNPIYLLATYIATLITIGNLKPATYLKNVSFELLFPTGKPNG